MLWEVWFNNPMNSVAFRPFDVMALSTSFVMMMAHIYRSRASRDPTIRPTVSPYCLAWEQANPNSTHLRNSSETSGSDASHAQIHAWLAAVEEQRSHRAAATARFAITWTRFAR